MSGDENLSETPNGHATGCSSVFYLGYGSNLSRKAFIGNRKVNPLSARPAVCLSLRLTFDSAGLPYTDPCYATSFHPDEAPKPGPQSWSKPLVGVLYELTPEDFARIVSTEGGGSWYDDAQVECCALDKQREYAPDVGDKLDGCEMMQAHTLIQPPTHSPVFVRPTTGLASPSLRYLRLMRDGAHEHGLPLEYRRWLDSVQTFEPVTSGQKIGRWLFTHLWDNGIIWLVQRLQQKLSNSVGASPESMIRLTAWTYGIGWLTYDWGLKQLLGEGERYSGKPKLY